jgi:hypothetical protein
MVSFKVDAESARERLSSSAVLARMEMETEKNMEKIIGFA